MTVSSCTTPARKIDSSEQYICDLSVYGFKSGESAAISSRSINSVFGNGAVTEDPAQDWFGRFGLASSTSMLPHGRDLHPEWTIVGCGSW
ncbi:hypothetical protein Y032_0112g323 [Ancylostoma ceylanicum]|uniref:Mos1 transposase HTH domain-containing protein n=1 Tax=Ancylostoma ceylanicum TaxID=53326 RepID=A0A016TDX0_9BILA|nr:hypothetical protein Y032_0112g323 [Ancylostoma ceylanicum]